MHESLDQEIRTLQAIFWSERDPDGLAFAPLADAFRRKGAFREALDLLTDGMSRHPDYATGHVVATKLYFDNGMHSEAELAARRVLTLDPENLVGLATLTSLLVDKGEVGEAARHRTMLMAVDPQSEEARSVAGLDVDGGGAEPPPAAEFTELVTETMDREGSPDSLLDDLTLEPFEPGDEWAAGEDLSEAMETLGLGEGDDVVMDDTVLPGPEAEFADLDALDSDEPVEELVGTVDFGGAIDLDGIEIPEAPHIDSDDVVDLAALAPDEPDAEVMDVALLAPDVDDVVDLAALAPDDSVEESARSVAGEPPGDDGEVDDDPSEPIYTRTLAELYIKQGFQDKALEVLRSLQAKNPDATDLAERIEAIERGEARPAKPVDAPPVDGNGHTEEDVERRAQELADSGHDGGTDVDTPFAWNAPDQSKEAAEGDEPPAGRYFDQLLEWEHRVEP